MNVRSGFVTGLIVIVAVQLIMGFGAIALFHRIGPAVESILRENVASIQSAETMAFAAARFSGDGEERHRVEYEEALRKARQNVTVDAERPALDRLESEGRAFFAGDSTALARIVGAAEDLIATNRSAMDRADHEARRLAQAGAWAVVVLSLAGFLISVIVSRHMLFGVIEPIEELEAVLRAFRQGDTYRRCQARAATDEMRQILGSINRLLDRAQRIEDEPRAYEPL